MSAGEGTSRLGFERVVVILGARCGGRYTRGAPSRHSQLLMKPILRVALPVPLDRLFDYASNGVDAAPGSRVLVPFGRRDVVGVAVEYADATDLSADRLKPATRALDAAPLIGAELMSTLRRAARYYQYPLGEVLHAALPAALRSPRPLPAPVADQLALTADGEAARNDPKRRRGTRIDALLELLADGPAAMTQLDAVLPGWRPVSLNAVKRGWIERTARTASSRTPIAGPPLNDAQRAAADAIVAARGFAPFVLDGVTGSGKTLVYLAAI
ncbi:MAG TPA: hypothetical protein VFL30_08235, partial [Rhodanobacteraceae bacterium]|nr:hypothetical protein [Rhodanobacteraceae bacterium]